MQECNPCCFSKKTPGPAVGLGLAYSVFDGDTTVSKWRTGLALDLSEGIQMKEGFEEVKAP